jgi:transcription elongation factor Elf1
MGKRKSTRKPQKKVKTTLDKQFPCVFCNHETSVTTKFDMENKIANLTCSACAVHWSCAITGCLWLI